MTRFQAFQLAAGIQDFQTEEISGGEVRARFTREGSQRLLERLRKARTALSLRPALEIAKSLGEVGRRFGEPSDPIRDEAEHRLPAEAGLSGPMAAAIIDGMARDWMPEPLECLLRTDFPDPAVLDGFRPNGVGGLSTAVGGSLALHVGAGNVPGVGVTSVIRSLLVKCPVLLKPGRSDLTLPCLFARALAESDPGLAEAVAVVYWPRGDGGELEDQAICEADRVVAYGGGELVDALRQRLPPTTPLVAYHHRLSVGAVAREHLQETASAEAVARNAAFSVSAFDQRGCVSPQVIWVEEGAPITPVAWAQLLACQLDELAPRLPAGPRDMVSSAALQQQKGASDLKRAAGTEDRVFTGPSGSATVIFDPEPHSVPLLSDVGRVALIRPVDDLTRLPELLGPTRRVLQTLAIAVSEPRRSELASLLVDSGISRICSFEDQPWPPAWWRHDGTEPLRALVHWMVVDGGQ